MSSTSKVVQVTNIASKATEKDVREFFSFCGKIDTLVLESRSSTDDPQTATVTYYEEKAATTAGLLNQTTLRGFPGSQMKVTRGASLGDGAHAAQEDYRETDDDSISENDKPRARIAAEYLASGYELSDDIIEALLNFDKQHSISERFYNALKRFDAKFGATEIAKSATERAKSVDQTVHASDAAYSIYNTALSFYHSVTHTVQTEASKTAVGRKLGDLYSEGEKTVMHVKNEADRLYELRTGKKPEKKLAVTDDTITETIDESKLATVV